MAVFELSSVRHKNRATAKVTMKKNRPSQKGRLLNGTIALLKRSGCYSIHFVEHVHDLLHRLGAGVQEVHLVFV